MKKASYILCATIILMNLGCKKSTFNEMKGTFQPSTKGRNVPGTGSAIMQWQKSLGSSATDFGFAVANAKDGSGYVLAGYTLGNNNGDVGFNHGGSDAWIVKIRPEDGSPIWKKVFGGTGTDKAYAITATLDGGYIFAGETTSTDGDLAGKTNHGGNDLWVVKITADGNIEWQAVLGGSASDMVGIGSNIVQNTDGSYLINGQTASNDGDVSNNHGGNDIWLVKLNNSGNLISEKTYGGSATESGGYILPIANGYMLLGATSSTDGDLNGQTNRGGSDVWLLGIDYSGNLTFNKTYGGSGNEAGGTVMAAAGGGYVFSSATPSNNGDVSGNHGYVDTWVVKVSVAGMIVWQNCFGGSDMDNARIRDVDAAGNIVLVGYTFSRNGDITSSKGGEDLWVLRLDASGKNPKSRVFGGKGGDMANDAKPTGDGSYITAGRSNSKDGDVTGNHGGEDMWVVKFKF